MTGEKEDPRTVQDMLRHSNVTTSLEFYTQSTMAQRIAAHYDAKALQNLGISKSRIDTSNTISAFGSPYATFGGAAGLYCLGLGTHNEHLAETGRLGAEALADASIIVEGLKLATNRERPNEGNGQGGFWPHGTRSYGLDGAFPSGHAAASFALARVIASEYPSKPAQVRVCLGNQRQPRDLTSIFPQTFLSEALSDI